MAGYNKNRTASGLDAGDNGESAGFKKQVSLLLPDQDTTESENSPVFC
jgi:hypothetical protein